MEYQCIGIKPGFWGRGVFRFRLAPSAFADIGLISSSSKIFDNSSFYSAFGVGVRLANESFAFKTINLSIGFIPRRFNDQSSMFYIIDTGYNPLIPPLNIEKPEILREEVIFPF